MRECRMKEEGIEIEGRGVVGGKCRVAQGGEVEWKRKGLRWKGVGVRGRGNVGRPRKGKKNKR